MIAALQSEIRKLLSIRSTYILAGIAMLLFGLLACWGMGYKGDPTSDRLFIGVVLEGSSLIAVFGGLIAALSITHEYRYNTIMYTLTASASRSRVLLSKLIVISVFATLFLVVSCVVAVLLAWLGASLRDGGMVAQQFFWWDTLWRTFVSAIAWVWLGLLFGVLFRHVVGAIVCLLLLPGTVESLLGILLKENVKYLPYTALEQVQTGLLLSPAKGALIFSLYLVAAWILAWTLFLRRDAN